MSKELVKPDKNSGFTSEGYEEFPSLYSDGELIHELGGYVLNKDNDPEPRITDGRLNEWVGQYHKFLQRNDLMPRAKDQANHHMRHLLFERAYRSGYFVQAPDDASELES